MSCKPYKSVPTCDIDRGEWVCVDIPQGIATSIHIYGDFPKYAINKYVENDFPLLDKHLSAYRELRKLGDVDIYGFISDKFIAYLVVINNKIMNIIDAFEMLECLGIEHPQVVSVGPIVANKLCLSDKGIYSSILMNIHQNMKNIHQILHKFRNIY